MAETVAGAEPDSAAKNEHATIVVMANPPRTLAAEELCHLYDFWQKFRHTP